MRADLIIEMYGRPGQSYRVIDDFYRDLAYRLLDFAYDPAKPTREHAPDAPAKHRPTRCPSLTSPPPNATRSRYRAA
jgi:hypothetical protein